MFEKIAETIAEQLSLNAADIKPEDRLVEDLKADSLDIVALVMELESANDIEIPDEDLLKLKTVGDIVEYLENH